MTLQFFTFILLLSSECIFFGFLFQVILFLKRTLAGSVFRETLRDVGGAEQYVSHLMDVEEVVEAEDIMAMIGQLPCLYCLTISQ